MPSPLALLATAGVIALVGTILCAASPQRARALFLPFAVVQSGLAVIAGLMALFGSGDVVALWAIPGLGTVSVGLDPLSGLFVAVVSVVFLICAPTVARYDGEGREGTFLAFHQALLAALLLIFVAADVFSFLVSWEAASLLLFALVVLGHDGRQARRPAFVMLAMGEIGMVAGAAGLLILAGAAGGLGFADLRVASDHLAPGLVWAVFGLTFFGFGVKAGLVPVNQWLPDAYVAAPRAFRAVLAGATINIGVYALFRIEADLLAPAMTGPGLVALVIGALTALTGILYATIQPDMRRMLAHSSIENMGIVTAGLGAGLVFAASGHGAVAAIALVTALYHMTNHALYKALLFTGTGSIEEIAGADMDRLGGLLRRIPVAGVSFLAGILAISALPPFNGFVSEWLTLETMLRAAVLSSTAAKVAFALSGAVLALTAGLAVTCFVKAFAMSFLGKARSPEAETAGPMAGAVRGPMAAFAVLCLVLGVTPTYVIPALDHAVSPIVHESAADALVPPFFLADSAVKRPLPPAFRADFHNLGAEVGGSMLPGRGLVVLHRGGAKNPVVFAMSTSYMAVALIVILGLVALIFRLPTRGRAVVRRVAWDGGLRFLRPSYTYTATGFSNPVRVVFQALLRPRTVEDSTEAVAEHFRMSIRRTVAERHVVDRVTDPVLAAIKRLADLVRRMHLGRVNAYAAYVLIVLLAVLALGYSASTGGF